MFALDRQGRLISSKGVRGILEQTQQEANAAITFQDDLRTYGEIDKWAYPKTNRVTLVGDCEDYCLYKRKKLTEAGIPSSVLLLTICKDPNQQGHCVLSVVTNHYDLILCNLHRFVTTPRVMQAEGYVFLYRQQLGRGIDDPWDILNQ